MKAAPFEYARAETVEHALALLAEHGSDGKLLAGGQSLVPMMAMRLARPAWLIDIHRLEALKSIHYTPQQVQIGACVRQCVLDAEPELARQVPLVKKALAWVGHIQTRHRGTIGGSLAHADPSAELPLVAACLQAEIRLRRAQSERVVAAAEFFAGPMMTAIAPDECLVEVSLPIWAQARLGCAFDEVSIRHGDFAIVAALAQVGLDADGRCRRVALGVAGVGPAPIALNSVAMTLIGSSLEDVAIAAVADAAARTLDPDSDLHATREYRLHLARVLIRRVLSAARNEAMSQP